MRNLLLLISILLASCVSIEDDFSGDTNYYYINNSSHSIVISSKVNDYLAAHKLDSIISIGDTIQLFSRGGTTPFESHATVTIIFDATKCFTFMADTINLATDIRSQFAYERVKRGRDNLCYYTVVDSLYNKAVNCP